ncbi:inactive polyglycylase TTLL10 isoform X6 [Panthera leo]|uniref:inactive polyglycylase TTLL10 isoform X6 n=1 Tax=Panthera leo TaxID=9689 RepID=UPI001C6996BE|nr:inactive polyglycylase TTLL10 isoform X6 [Panthera leo]
MSPLCRGPTPPAPQRSPGPAFHPVPGCRFLPVFLPDQGKPRLEQTGCRDDPASTGHQAPRSPQRQEPATSRGPSPGPREAPLPEARTEDCPKDPRQQEEGQVVQDCRGPAEPHPGARLGPQKTDGEQPRGAAPAPAKPVGPRCRISSYCKGKGWQRIEDSRREDYKLKWCEVKCRDSYYSFREGEQLLYQLPNNKLLTTKIGLLSALREYSRVVSRTHKTSPCAQAKSRKDTTSALEELTWTSPGCFGPQRVLKMEEFFPETYRLDIRDEREAFFTLFDENQTWICKPTASNQGKGIFLLRNQEEVAALQVKTQSIEDDPIYRKMPFRAPQARVVQRYIQNPLLLDGKKFDVRSYLLIACATPYMVFFGHGYARLTLSLYDPHSSDLSGHLTNQFMQKKSPLYMLLKEDTVWSMDHLNRYINDKFRKTKGLPRDWVFTTFTKRMQQIMAHCFQAVKSKLQCKLGYFDLIGCDFLIDENFKVWLLEMNSNPALHTNCEVLKEVIPGVVTETLDLALETFQKSLRGQKMLPLLSQRHFVLLHDGEADLWPRPGGSRGALRPPPPLRAAPRPGARTPAPPRGPGGAHARPRPPGRGPEGSTQSREPGAERPREGAGGPAREPSPGLAEEERKNAGHRGS